jgi:transposase
MAAKIQLSESARNIDFEKLAHCEKSPAARVRAIMLNSVKNGKSNREIAGILGVHRVTVGACIARVNERGEDGLRDKKRPGGQPKMTTEDEQHFAKRFEQEHKNKKGGRLTGYDAQQILEEMGFSFKKTRVYEILHKLGLVWITSRSIHPKADEAAQESFKKTSLRRLKKSSHPR